ncbi:hypothetical protein Hs30E_18180 [Lactococcus hodotermopsidis]|uniref:Bacterial Ig domain-containing protein n=1 Tax=Pseudolactococcus hodotermopsidis TaxID=2709157 RepID=A0A6A0BHI8_9LACT|nr:hypothetical protein Hs30E_18180 [Lactococcus hodotermopsidis]
MKKRIMLAAIMAMGLATPVFAETSKSSESVILKSDIKIDVPETVKTDKYGLAEISGETLEKAKVIGGDKTVTATNKGKFVLKKKISTTKPKKITIEVSKDGLSKKVKVKVIPNKTFVKRMKQLTPTVEKEVTADENGFAVIRGEALVGAKITTSTGTVKSDKKGVFTLKAQLDDAEPKTIVLTVENKKWKISKKVEITIKPGSAYRDKKSSESRSIEQSESEQSRVAAEQAQVAEQSRVAAEQAQAAEQSRVAAEQAQVAEQSRVAAEQAQAAEQSRAATAQAPSTTDRMVYVTGGGKSDVYWYGTSLMPSNTNKNNIVTMSESEAIAQGKRHSLKE